MNAKDVHFTTKTKEDQKEQEKKLQFNRTTYIHTYEMYVAIKIQDLCLRASRYGLKIQFVAEINFTQLHSLHIRIHE